ncbi:hypothetical protein ENSA7_72260 [Enhygromyxa salina]|uniref:Uncharacterized protein n=1 Tax=Enhygromyxa salina TaxID=215803 RepID=A0A2S9XUM1_9BACT|nr:hypothetical protein ENSA7_72260 [Enhygromyxa salina]
MSPSCIGDDDDGDEEDYAEAARRRYEFGLLLNRMKKQ